MSLIVQDSRYLITALSFRGRKIKQTKTSAAVHEWNGPISIRDSRIEVKYVYGILQLKRINLVSELYTSAVAGQYYLTKHYDLYFIPLQLSCFGSALPAKTFYDFYVL